MIEIENVIFIAEKNGCQLEAPNFHKPTLTEYQIKVK